MGKLLLQRAKLLSDLDPDQTNLKDLAEFQFALTVTPQVLACYQESLGYATRSLELMQELGDMSDTTCILSANMLQYSYVMLGRFAEQAKVCGRLMGELATSKNTVEHASMGCYFIRATLEMAPGTRELFKEMCMYEKILAYITEGMP